MHIYKLSYTDVIIIDNNYTVYNIEDQTRLSTSHLPAREILWVYDRSVVPRRTLRMEIAASRERGLKQKQKQKLTFQ